MLHRQADRGVADALRFGRAGRAGLDDRAGAEGRAPLPAGASGGGDPQRGRRAVPAHRDHADPASLRCAQPGRAAGDSGAVSRETPHEHRLHELATAFALPPAAERQLAALLDLLAADPEAPTPSPPRPRRSTCTSPTACPRSRWWPSAAGRAATDRSSTSAAARASRAWRSRPAGRCFDLVEATARKCRVHRAGDRASASRMRVPSARARRTGPRSKAPAATRSRWPRARRAACRRWSSTRPAAPRGGHAGGVEGRRDAARSRRGGRGSAPRHEPPRGRRVAPFAGRPPPTPALLREAAPTPAGYPAARAWRASGRSGGESSTPN